MALLFAVAAAVGVAALLSVKRCDYRHLVVLTNAMLALVVMMSTIDASSTWAPRSAHLYLLPLAAASAFIFGGRNAYMGTAFPIICLTTFALYGSRIVDLGMDGLMQPAETRLPWNAINNVAAAALLGAVLVINRYEAALNAKKARTANDLAKAIGSGELVVVFQLQVDAKGRPLGAEALVRWLHPKRGMLPPHEFIPLAEETHLIPSLGLEVMRQACETLRSWHQDPDLRDLVMAVNISPIQLQDPDFAKCVEEIVRRTGVQASRLELELTESALSEDAQTMIQAMWALRKLGIRWSLDDFGTGFSSLALLRTLPVEKLKVDRHFVQDAYASLKGRKLLEKILELSAVLELTTLAEGVESRDQWEMLIELGCHQFQGYYFSMPVAADELRVLLKPPTDSPLEGRLLGPLGSSQMQECGAEASTNCLNGTG